MEWQGWDGVRRGRKEETTKQDTRHIDVTRHRRDETQKWKEQMWKEQMEGVMEGTHQSTWSR